MSVGGSTYYKVYALKPSYRFGGGARVIEDSVLVLQDPDRILEYYMELIKAQDDDDMLRRSNRYGATGNMVMLSVQRTDNPTERGRTIYCCNTARKEKGRIRHTDRRLVLPATRAYGKLVETTWDWWDSWWSGLDACIAAGDVTEDQAAVIRERVKAPSKCTEVDVQGWRKLRETMDHNAGVIEREGIYSTNRVSAVSRMAGG